MKLYWPNSRRANKERLAAALSLAKKKKKKKVF
jgi:hypothetical protein